MNLSRRELCSMLAAAPLAAAPRTALSVRSSEIRLETGEAWDAISGQETGQAMKYGDQFLRSRCGAGWCAVIRAPLVL